MGSLIKPLPFAALTVLAWGSYGNWLHKSSGVMPSEIGDLKVRQFFCVGLAYFILAIVIPLIFLQVKGEKGSFTVRGSIWSLGAGICGALGALGIIIALTNHGAPIYVMPLVFGTAPVVNTLVSMVMNRNFKQANSAFLAGIVLVAVGAALVFVTKPAADKPHASSEKGTQTSQDDSSVTGTPKEKTDEQTKKVAKPNWLAVICGILLTGLSWGTYGSVLHKGQAYMQGSRLRPLICVGISYFIVAVIVPLFLIQGNPLKGMESGSLFAFMAGVAGAVGAFGIILSFTYGGRPIYIMPLVFGGAPIVNTMIASYGAWDKISPLFISSLTIVIVGAVMVLICQPKAGKKPAPQPPPEPPPKPPPEPKAESDSESAEQAEEAEETDET